MSGRVVYIVVRDTGDRDNFWREPVAAYLERTHAESHAAEAARFASEEATRFRPLYNAWYAEWRRRFDALPDGPGGRRPDMTDLPKPEGRRNPFDPAHDPGIYDTPDYKVEECPLWLHADEMREERGL